MSSTQQGSSSAHLTVVASRRSDRAAALVESISLPDVVAPLSAHRRLCGPYTAVGQLLGALVPEALRRWPEVVNAHQIELLSAAPALRGSIPATRETLTSLTVPNERTRFYSRMRTLRLAHGLVEFVSEHLTRLGGGPRRLVVNDVHHADPTDQEFLAVALRRISPDLLVILLGSTQEFLDLADDRPGIELMAPLGGGLPTALRTYCHPVIAEPAPSTEVSTEDDRVLAQRFVAEDGVDDDPRVLAAYSRLEPELVAALRDARAEELEASGDPAWAYGAIPYHREHGAEPRVLG